jgi:hypothetical protein
VPLDELALDELLEHLVDLLQRRERVQPLGALLQLAGRLRPAQHEHREDAELAVRDAERVVDQVPVLRCAAAGSAREPDEALAREPSDCLADRLLVVLDDGIAVRGLIACEAERVERQRVDVGRRPLLLDQAAENPGLDRVEVHGPRR